MAFSQNTTPTLVKQPRYMNASIGNGDASAWKFLYDSSGLLNGPNGRKITALTAASNDGSSARIIQVGRCRVFTGATVTIATPGVVSWTLANGNDAAIGDQIVWLNNGDTLPTGLSFNTTYFIISGGFTVGVSFELATTAGGAAINTTGSQSGTHQIALIRPQTSLSVPSTSGTDGVAATSDLLSLWTGLPVDNDGQKYFFLENTGSATTFDALAVSSTTTVTANKMMSIDGVAADF